MKTYQQLSQEDFKALELKLKKIKFYKESAKAFDLIKRYYGEAAKKVKFELYSEYDDQGGTDLIVSSFEVYDENNKFILLEDKNEYADDRIDDMIDEIRDNFSFGDDEITSINLIEDSKYPEIYKLVEL